MSYSISKELLCEVVNKNIIDYTIRENEIILFSKNAGLFWCDWIGEMTLNLYELAHKCKEWALKQGYMIESYLDLESNGVSVIKYENKYISAETEQQAVFDACHWILDNKDKQ